MLRRARGIMVLCLGIGLVLIAPLSRAQEAPQSEPEAMYYRYLELPSLVKGLAVRSEQASPAGIRQDDRITASSRRSK